MSPLSLSLCLGLHSIFLSFDVFKQRISRKRKEQNARSAEIARIRSTAIIVN